MWNNVKIIWVTMGHLINSDAVKGTGTLKWSAWYSPLVEPFNPTDMVLDVIWFCKAIALKDTW